MRSSVPRATALLIIITLSACSGGGSPSNPVPARAPVATSSAPASTSSKTRATFVVHWPTAAQDAAKSRRRDTISASTQSISVTVNGGSPTVVNKPTLTGSPSTTSITIYAPPGDDGFTFTAWDKTNGDGAILDQATANQVILADANNMVSVSLNGVCAALVPSLYSTGTYVTSTTKTVPLVSGTRSILTSARIIGPAPKTFQFTRIDADGNTVLTSGDVTPISVVESGSTPHVTISQASAPSNTMFSLTPLVGEPDGFSTTITATTPDCGPASPLFPNSFQLSTAAVVLVSDENAGILAYDQDGTPVLTAPISTTKNIVGLAYSPKSSGYLVAIEPKSTSGGIAFQTLSLTGSVLGSSSFTPQNSPDGGDTSAASELPGEIVYDPADGNFYFALRAASAGTTGGNGAVEEYAISGATATYINALSPDYDPYCFAILPNGNLVNDDLYSPNMSGYYFIYLIQYSLASSVPNPLILAAPSTSLSFDSTRGEVLSLAYPKGSSEMGTIYDETLKELGTFTFPSTTFNSGAYYVSAYNPANDELYMFSGNTPAGLSGATIAQGGSTTSNLPPGAFPGLSAPTQAVVLP